MTVYVQEAQYPRHLWSDFVLLTVGAMIKSYHNLKTYSYTTGLHLLIHERMFGSSLKPLFTLSVKQYSQQVPKQ